MTAHVAKAESLKEALKKAVKTALQPDAASHAVSALRETLIEAQDALRESGFEDAVLELRLGLQTDYGRRYTAYLRNDRCTFETLLFSIFDAGRTFRFRAEGQVEAGVNENKLLGRVRVYRLEPLVVEIMTGMLRQFGSANRLAVD